MFGATKEVIKSKIKARRKKHRASLSGSDNADPGKRNAMYKKRKAARKKARRDTSTTDSGATPTPKKRMY